MKATHSPAPTAGAHLLLVDDDTDLLKLLSLRLHASGYRVSTAETAEAALGRIAVERFSLVVSDVRLPDRDGLALFEEIRRTCPVLPVILLTAHGSIPDAVEATSRGVFGYLTKPFDSQALLEKIAQALQVGGPMHVGDDADDNDWRDEIISHSNRMATVLDEARLVAASDASILIRGDSGTGKELLARAIHRISSRANAPFVAINCGAIPEQLLESELFGHVKGAFTGAATANTGLFLTANRGTVFLDEIGDMPLALQVKLLRVLETGTFMRVGSTTPQETDVRVVAATNRNPLQAVAAGALREDLFYRLNVFPIEMPALRERRADLPLLVDHFLKEIGAREGAFKRASAAALDRLAQYRWPGNVRELRNVLQRAYVMTAGAEIGDQWLPRDVLVDPVSGSEGGTLQVAVGTPLAAVERQLILATLEHYGNQKERTAAALGVSLKTLYNRLKEYGS